MNPVRSFDAWLAKRNTKPPPLTQAQLHYAFQPGSGGFTLDIASLFSGCGVPWLNQDFGMGNLAYWAQNPENPNSKAVPMQISISTAQSRASGYSAFIIQNVAPPYPGYATFGPQPSLRVTPGATYSLSFWDYSVDLAFNNFKTYIQWNDANNSAISKTDFGYSAGVYGQWTEFVFSDTAPAGAVQAIPLFQAIGENACYITDFCLSQTGGGGGGNLNFQSAFLSSDVAMSTVATWYDGPSITLGAGTWLIAANATIKLGSGGGFETVKIWNGTTAYGAAENSAIGANQSGQVSIPGCLVTLSGSTTVKLSAAATGGGFNGSTLRAATFNQGSGNNATWIAAIQVA